MKRVGFFLIVFLTLLLIPSSFADDDDEGEIFRDYCREGLCLKPEHEHTGCKNGILHDGKFQVPPCKPNTSLLMNLTQEMKDNIVDLHNYQRNYVACGGLMDYYHFKPACRMGAVKWDRELEATAYLHVTYCLFEHDQCRFTLKYPMSGQNLGWYEYEKPGFSHYVTPPIHTIVWYMEYQDTWEETLYQYMSKPGHPMIGHFLTSIHEKNSRIGCVLAHLFELKFQTISSIFTCNYAISPIKRRAIYSPCKKAASKCETGTHPKYPYLCSTKEVYDWTRGSTASKYDGDGTETFECGASPDSVQDPPADFVKNRTTVKPGKPTKPSKPGGSTSKPGSGTAVPHPPSKPAEHPVPDYEENELDPPYSGATQIRKEFFYKNVPKLAFILLAIRHSL